MVYEMKVGEMGKEGGGIRGKDGWKAMRDGNERKEIDGGLRGGEKGVVGEGVGDDDEWGLGMGMENRDGEGCRMFEEGLMGGF